MVQKGVASVKLAMEKLEHFLELGGTKKDITLLVISGIALIVSIFDLVPLPFDASWAAIILCGIPIILEAVIGLITAFDIKADVLVSLALIASVCIGEDFAAGEVAFIMQLGGLLEELTVARARAGIEKLVHLTPQTARVILGGEETAVPAEAVRVGDLLRVLPGETIPVDGIIVVTSPQDLVSMIVTKAVKMAEMMNIPVLGLVENYSYFQCPDCGAKHTIFGESHLEQEAMKLGLPQLAKLPIDPKVAAAFDAGKIESLETNYLAEVAAKLDV